MKRVKIVYQLLVFLFYFCFSLYIQKDSIKEFPHTIHAWAHTDHYALSKGFNDNGFDFFRPETLTSNKQFPSKNHPEKLTRITSSDFPIVQYTAAIAMKVTGNEEPVVYRTLMLLLASLGFLYLFKISFFVSGSSIFSLLVPILVLFTPVYLDYQIGFLPSVAAMSFLFMGAYHYILYTDKFITKQLVFAVICLSVAAAIRTPFAIPLIAIMGYEILKLLNKQTSFKRIAIIGFGFLLPLVYFFYNQYLRSEYGSIFLGEPLYARNLEELKSNFLEAFQNWGFHYFHTIQWMVLTASLLGIATYRFLIRDPNEKFKSLADVTVIYGMGVLIYMVLMSRQLVHHDYYALDTFIPFLILLSAVVLSRMILINHIPHFGSFVALGLIIVALNANLALLSERRSPEHSEPYTVMYEDYSQLEQFLKRNDISTEHEILIYDPFAPNMPFVLSGYSGTNVMNTTHFSIEQTLDWNNEFIIVRDDIYYHSELPLYPQLINCTDFLDYGFGMFLLKKKASKSDDTDIFNWLGINPNQPRKTVNNYEGVQGVQLIDETGICTEEFAMTYRDTLSDHDYKLISLECNIEKTEEHEAFWHIHIRSEEEELFNEYIQISTKNMTRSRQIILPNDNNTWYISSYLYNPNENIIKYQDFEVKYY